MASFKPTQPHGEREQTIGWKELSYYKQTAYQFNILQTSAVIQVVHVKEN